MLRAPAHERPAWRPHTHTHRHTHTHQRKVIHGLSNQTCFQFWSFSYETQLFFLLFCVSPLPPQIQRPLIIKNYVMQDTWIPYVHVRAITCEIIIDIFVFWKNNNQWKDCNFVQLCLLLIWLYFLSHPAETPLMLSTSRLYAKALFHQINCLNPVFNDACFHYAY